MVTPKKIIVDGKEYSSIEALPPILRRIFADGNRNGLPDIFEKLIKDPEKLKALKHANPAMFMAGGEAYQSLKDLPEDLQKTLGEKLGINIQAGPTRSDPLEKARKIFLDQGQFVQGRDDYTKLFVVLVVVTALFLLGLGGVLFVFFFNQGLL
jgi:hypothetical protein